MNESVKELVEFKGKLISKGRYLFNKCLPEDYPLIDEAINKKRLMEIINDISLKYPSSVVIPVLDAVKELGFSMSTSEGYTLALDDIYSPELMQIAQELSGDVKKDMIKIKKDPEILKRLKELPFSIFIESGARGSWDQAKQLVLARGYVADANNKIRPNLIRSSLVKGLSQQEFFDSCWGSRKGLLDTALSTGDTGYLTRQLIYSTATIELGEEEDCGTTDCVEIDVVDENVAKSFLWRYHIGKSGYPILTKKDKLHKLIGKKVKFRSPIYCKNKKVCKTCYGNLNKILHSNQIGILATQAVGERATQLVLRTFHTSFRHDTMVLLENNNYLEISKVYDLVKQGLPVNTITCKPSGEMILAKVCDAYKTHLTDKMIVIKTMGNKPALEVTPEHKIMMFDGNYKKASDIRKGDRLMPYPTYSSDPCVVESTTNITLPEEEYFYDITVDNNFSNFGVKSGFFVHNSGVAQGDSKDNKNDDIISGMALAKKLFHKPSDIAEINKPEDLVNLIREVFDKYGDILTVHFEVIVAAMMWVGEKPWRLHKKREALAAEYVSILQIPTRSSWLLACAFSNIKQKVLDGLVSDDEDVESSLTKLFRY